MAWHNRFKQCNICKKGISKKLMPVSWHPASIVSCKINMLINL